MAKVLANVTIAKEMLATDVDTVLGKFFGNAANVVTRTPKRVRTPVNGNHLEGSFYFTYFSNFIHWRSQVLIGN